MMLTADVTTVRSVEIASEIIEFCKQYGALLSAPPPPPALPFTLLNPKKARLTELNRANDVIVCKSIIKSAKTALAENIPVG